VPASRGGACVWKWSATHKPWRTPRSKELTRLPLMLSLPGFFSLCYPLLGPLYVAAASFSRLLPLYHAALLTTAPWL